MENKQPGNRDRNNSQEVTMISALSIVAIFGIIVFLSGALFGVFILLVVSMHRTGHAPLSEAHGERAGAMSRRMLVASRTGGREIEE
jgi:hypothetical protein